jgi:hypothetical protein
LRSGDNVGDKAGPVEYVTLALREDVVSKNKANALLTIDCLRKWKYLHFPEYLVFSVLVKGFSNSARKNKAKYHRHLLSVDKWSEGSLISCTYLFRLHITTFMASRTHKKVLLS